MHSAAALALALTAGCTEPSFATGGDAGDTEAQGDAGQNDAAEPSLDASSADDSGVVDAQHEAAVPEPDASQAADSWWRALKKRYAIQARFFSKDIALAGLALYSHEIIYLAEVNTTDAGEVSLEMQRCRDRGNVVGPAVRDDFDWPHASELPPERLALVMGPDGIRSVGPGRPIGYDPVQPDGCAPGVRLRVDGRDWLPDGRCTCLPEALPWLPSDCRIIDADNDGAPGVTVQHVGFVNGPENVRTLDNTSFSQGVIHEDGSIEAHFVESYEHLSLDCGDEPCAQLTVAPCPLMFNKVIFSPLQENAPDGEAWGCESLLKEVDAAHLWPIEMLSFVQGC